MKLPSILLLLSLQAATAEWKPVEGKMLTPWGAKLDPAAVWAEYPRPQLQRENWTNLNGLWSHAIGKKGEEDAAVMKRLGEGTEEEDATVRSQLLIGDILVPFCPESSLSGVGKLIEPDQALWYRRDLPVRPVAGERTLLHFEAVDYETIVWVNGKEVGRHTGGNTPFTFDITTALANDANHLVVRVYDATEGYQLHGKQTLEPRGIWCGRVSGIWQTVWLEQVPERFVDGLDFETVVEKEKAEARDQNQERETGAEGKTGMGTSLLLNARLAGSPVAGESLRVTVSFDGKEVASGKGSGKLSIGIPEPRWWTPEHPDLYDLKVELLDGKGKVLDTVQSYTALRTLGEAQDAEGNLRLTLNGQPYFLFGTLDQGWWPDGLLTPPSDEAMLSDLKFLKDSGFNMVRKHVKVEPGRYYYHCDRLGIAVWQDQVSCSLGSYSEAAGLAPRWTRLAPNPVDAIWPEAAHQQWVTEYKAMVDHLRDHPSVFVWSTFNEAWGQHRSMEIGAMAKDYDPTRLVCNASGGNFWPVGDIAAEHHYPEPAFPFRDERFRDYIKVVGEMGGHGWPVAGHIEAPDKMRAYGPMARSLDEWKIRYSHSVTQIADLRRKGLSAAVYTQTSDMWNEVNGLLTYDRLSKVDAAWLKTINEPVISGRQAIPQGTRKGLPAAKP